MPETFVRQLRRYRQLRRMGYEQRMKCKLAAVVLVALACGDSAAEPTSTDNTEPSLEATAPINEASDAAEACLGPTTIELSGYAQYCTACLAGAVPRCADVAVPGPRKSEPVACAVPDCEATVSPDELMASAGNGTFGNPPNSESQLQGSCADGKTFLAVIGPLFGSITYYRDPLAPPVGAAVYSQTITDCACSGERWSGDALCPSPAFETAPPDGEMTFPFADGHRAAPCLCAD
jgi:hypothetical protein